MIRSALVALLLAVGSTPPAHALTIVWEAELSGGAQEPQVITDGFGMARVTYDDVALEMLVEIDFADLEGVSTIAHIHGPTADPFTGLAGVISPLPTFPGFPAGVTAGSYAQVFDLDMAASFNSAFVTASGSVADARATLLAALDGGRAYVNVHSTLYAGGEIRGFLREPGRAEVPAPAALGLLAGAVGLLAATAGRRRLATVGGRR